MNKYVIVARVTDTIIADSDVTAKAIFEESLQFPCYDVRIIGCAPVPRNYWEEILTVKRMYLPSPGGAVCAENYKQRKMYYVDTALGRLQKRFGFNQITKPNSIVESEVS